MHILSLVTDNNSGIEENDRRIVFMINLHESMGRARVEIASQTRICSQTRYRLRSTIVAEHISKSHRIGDNGKP